MNLVIQNVAQVTDIELEQGTPPGRQMTLRGTERPLMADLLPRDDGH